MGAEGKSHLGHLGWHLSPIVIFCRESCTVAPWIIIYGRKLSWCPRAGAGAGAGATPRCCVRHTWLCWHGGYFALLLSPLSFGCPSPCSASMS